MLAEGQNTTSPLKLGTASDHGFTGSGSAAVDQPAIEMLDAARAFAEWCNAQGGIRGLPIEIVDLDAALTNVPLVMERTCAEVFAMVGGGWTFDDLMFPRFHECGMISFPAFTTTAAASAANGKVQPIPDPIDREPTAWLKWIAKTYPDSVDDIAIVHPDLTPTRSMAERLAAAMQAVGDFGEPALTPFDQSESFEWSDVVDTLRNNGARSVGFIGDPGQMAEFLAAIDAAAFDVDVVFGDTNLMGATMLAGSDGAPPGTTSLVDVRIRTIHGPMDAGEPSAGIESYLEMMRNLDPPGRVASLGIHTTSAMLLFVTAANSCLDSNDNMLERECVLAEAKKISSWTAGGLHAATDPAANEPSECIAVLGLERGRWVRVFPVLQSSDDEGNGFHCDDEIAQVDGDFGDPSVGIDPSRLN